MKKKANSKNIIVIMLIILVLALAIGYTAFSDILTISGTANAKGTFDLEFQNAEVVKNVGADEEKTTAVISEDRDTLTVNAVDLSYPGAGVEFAVDIVNVGTMPAKVQAVTPTKITGSEKIKVTGLDVIKTDHPTIEVGDRCNIHFTVEWPVEAGEIEESESTISFGLQIEYIQATGEVFQGSPSHVDTDKNGNIVAGGEVEETEDNRLISKITPQDYGKSINYVATVKNNETQENEEVSNWKVLYNDKTNIYLILDEYLPIELVPAESGLNITGTYSVYSNINRESLLNGLINSNYWSEFANGVTGATAIGTPKLDILMKSYNEKHNEEMNIDSENTDSRILDNTDTLYVLHNNIELYNGVDRYWLADAYPNDSVGIWRVSYRGEVDSYHYNIDYVAVRPVVILPSSITGTVGETIEIK